MGQPVEELAALPGDGKPWYKQAHLLKLNFITLSMVLFCMFSHSQINDPPFKASNRLPPG